MYDPATVATNVINPKEIVIVSVGVKAVTKSAVLTSASDTVSLLLMLDKMASETRREEGRFCLKTCSDAHFVPLGLLM